VFFGGSVSTSQLIAVPAALMATFMLIRLGRARGTVVAGRRTA